MASGPATGSTSSAVNNNDGWVTVAGPHPDDGWTTVAGPEPVFSGDVPGTQMRNSVLQRIGKSMNDSANTSLSMPTDGGFGVPRTLAPGHPPALTAYHPPTGPIETGVEDALVKGSRIATPGQRMSGAHNIVQGAGKVGSVMLPAAAMAAPIATGLGLAGGTLLGAGSGAVAGSLGAQPETMDEFGNVTGGGKDLAEDAGGAVGGVLGGLMHNLKGAFPGITNPETLRLGIKILPKGAEALKWWDALRNGSEDAAANKAAAAEQAAKDAAIKAQAEEVLRRQQATQKAYASAPSQTTPQQANKPIPPPPNASSAPTVLGQNPAWPKGVPPPPKVDLAGQKANYEARLKAQADADAAAVAREVERIQKAKTSGESGAVPVPPPPGGPTASSRVPETSAPPVNDVNQGSPAMPATSVAPPAPAPAPTPAPEPAPIPPPPEPVDYQVQNIKNKVSTIKAFMDDPANGIPRGTVATDEVLNRLEQPDVFKYGQDRELMPKNQQGFARNSSLAKRNGEPHPNPPSSNPHDQWVKGRSPSRAYQQLVKDGYLTEPDPNATSGEPIPPPPGAPTTPDSAQSGVLSTMAKLESDPDVPISTQRLRNALGMDKSTFDKTMLKLRDRRQVYLSEHDHPMAVSEGERNGLIDGGNGKYYVAVQRRTTN